MIIDKYSEIIHVVWRNAERVVDCGRGIMYLVVCGNEGLFQKRADNKSFAGEIIVPSGKNEPGEDHDVAAKREIEEETELREVQLIPLDRTFNSITPKAHLYLMQGYLVIIDDKKDVKNLSEDEGDFVWLPLDTAMDKIDWAHGQPVLDRAVNYLKEERNMD